MGRGVDGFAENLQVANGVLAHVLLCCDNRCCLIKTVRSWMTKDKKRAWYLLQHSVLYWFSKEVDPAADFKKDIQGAIKLYLYTVKEVPGSGMR